MRDFLWLCWGAQSALRNTLLLWSYPSTVGDNTITLIDFQVRVTVWSSRLGRRPMRSRSPIHHRLLRHRRRRCLQDGWVRISRRATSYGFFSSRLRQSKSLCSAVVTIFQRKRKLNYRKKKLNSVELISVQRNCHKVHFVVEWRLVQPSMNWSLQLHIPVAGTKASSTYSPSFPGNFAWSPHFFSFCFVWTPVIVLFVLSGERLSMASFSECL